MLNPTLRILGGLLGLALASMAMAAPADWFRIQVVDEQTGRGVPMVELRTVNGVSRITDSNGLIAFYEPGLMGEEVFFHVSSHGYEFPKDGFGYRGIRLTPEAGSEAVVSIRRVNIAERLYRVTGAGIYRDSVLLGEPVPLKQPVLNGKVMGQDTVIATPYRGRLYWFWGDTDRVAYPLGNFSASGATSGLPGQGGLDPSAGVDLDYFVDESGFSKPMCPDLGPGLKWIEGLMTLTNQEGREMLLARVTSVRDLGHVNEWHLARFDDEREEFESLFRWPIQDGHDSSHPFRARIGGEEYFYLYPTLRVKADLEHLSDLARYEAYTCLRSGTKFRGEESVLDRDAEGRLQYGWKAGTDRLNAGQARRLIEAGKLERGESWIPLTDVETGEAVDGGRGSVFWNDYRQRWVMIQSGRPGEIWFAEGDTPVGPWVYARRVVSHDDYNFYNPTQHPFFDQEGGRLIYFEGTYTAAFSAAKAKTPRYDYNQVMYRLDLANPRLALPAPVYRVGTDDGGERLLMREQIARDDLWGRIREVAFFAIPPAREVEGMAGMIDTGDGEGTVLSVQPVTDEAGKAPLFWAMPMEESGEGEPSSSSLLVPLFAHRLAESGKVVYSTDAVEGAERMGEPVCRVWKNPMSLLLLDPEPQPVGRE